MTNAFIDPLDLPLTPPMDLNSTMPGVDKISPFPMQLRTRASVGLFGTRRDAGPTNDPLWLIRMHQGIDLLAPIGTRVFAAANGTVVGGSGTSVSILHDYGFKFFTFYQHLQNKLVANGDTVVSGQQIAEVGEFDKKEDHLHFEIRYPFDDTSPNFKNSLPVNATFAMYNWETKSFKNDDVTRHVIDRVKIISFEEVVRSRFLRFILINVEGESRDLYLPIQTGLAEDRSLVETVRLAFLESKKVRIVWRESLFFSKIQSTYDRTSVIAEIKIYN